MFLVPQVPSERVAGQSWWRVEEAWPGFAGWCGICVVLVGAVGVELVPAPWGL